VAATALEVAAALTDGEAGTLPGSEAAADTKGVVEMEGVATAVLVPEKVALAEAVAPDEVDGLTDACPLADGDTGLAEVVGVAVTDPGLADTVAVGDCEAADGVAVTLLVAARDRVPVALTDAAALAVLVALLVAARDEVTVALTDAAALAVLVALLVAARDRVPVALTDAAALAVLVALLVAARDDVTVALTDVTTPCVGDGMTDTVAVGVSDGEAVGAEYTLGS
jgi:hypothetical protein